MRRLCRFQYGGFLWALYLTSHGCAVELPPQVQGLKEAYTPVVLSYFRPQSVASPNPEPPFEVLPEDTVVVSVQ